MAFSRVAYPVMLVAVIAWAVVVPTLRVRRLTGAWPFGAIRNAGHIERLVNAALLLLGVGFGAWAVAYALLGPAALGVQPSWPALQWAGWCFAAAGLAVVILAQGQMGRSWRVGIDAEATPLVTSGLFRAVRNPIYSGIFLVLCGMLLVSPAWLLLGMVVAAVVLIAAQTRREERHLRALHGAAFKRWAARTGRFVPGLGRIR